MTDDALPDELLMRLSKTHILAESDLSAEERDAYCTSNYAVRLKINPKDFINTRYGFLLTNEGHRQQQEYRTKVSDKESSAMSGKINPYQARIRR